MSPIKKRLSTLSSAMIVALAVSSSSAAMLENWTTNLLDPEYTFGNVVWANGHYVVLGGKRNDLYDYNWKIFSSSDGISWTLRNSNGVYYSPNISGPIYTGNRFYALGIYPEDASYYSDDGITWNASQLGAISDIAYGLVSGQPRYVAVSIYPDPLYAGTHVSSDGVYWGLSSTQNFSSIAFGSGRFVAARFYLDGGGLFRSTLGTNWTQSYPSGVGVEFFNGLFFSTTSTGTNLLSADGINWAPVSTGLTNPVLPFTYSHGLYMGNANGFLATSIDGSNWVQYSKSFSFFASDGSRLVAILVNNGLYATCSEPFVKVESTGTPRVLNLFGLIGRSYQVDAADSLSSDTNQWYTLTNLTLPTNPYSIVDPTPPGPQRFYRAAIWQ